MHWSAFPCQNFLKISIQTEVERFGPGGNLCCQSGPPPEVVLFDRPVESDIAVPFSEIFVSSPTPACHHSQNGGSDVSVYECSVCKLQTQELNVLLMYSCTQGSRTAGHLNLFFLLVFVSF